jgi:hypothetical protein
VLASGADYLEAPDAEEGLAAADIVARLKGWPRHGTPCTVAIDAWVGRIKSKPSEALIEKARRSITQILTAPSELLEAWRESEDFEGWRRGVEEVSAHL